MRFVYVVPMLLSSELQSLIILLFLVVVVVVVVSIIIYWCDSSIMSGNLHFSESNTDLTNNV